jgi:hypothetical protein
MAEKKRLEGLAINLNVSKAYRKNYTFSKLYFIYGQSNDSLLNGTRSGIFLDSNLIRDPAIVMTEDFYLIAETDNIYNSSIGFIEEDSARYVKERGPKTTTEASIVVKNKYRHQLKKPFPYKAYWTPIFKSVTNNIRGNAAPTLYAAIGGAGFENKETYVYDGEPLQLEIPYDFSYRLFSSRVRNLNSNLLQYHHDHPMPEVKETEHMKLFLY